MELPVLFYFDYNSSLHRRTSQKFLKLNLSVLFPSILKCRKSFHDFFWKLQTINKTAILKHFPRKHLPSPLDRDLSVEAIISPIDPHEAGLGLGEASDLGLHRGRGLAQFPLPPPFPPVRKKVMKRIRRKQKVTLPMLL